MLTAAVLLFAAPCWSVTGDQPTTRIVSLVPSVTETLFAIGAGNQLVGVSDFCKWPPEAGLLPTVGGYINPNMEKIVELRPTVVVAMESQPEFVDKLRRLQIAVAAVKTDSLRDVFAALTNAGEISGKAQEARKFRQQIDSRLGVIRERHSTGTRVRALIVVGRQPATLQNIYAAGPNTYLGEILQIAGGANVLTNSSQPYPPLSKEQVVALNPEVIIDTSLGEAGKQQTVRDAHKKVWEQLPMLPAVKSGRIHYISDPHLTIPGPAIIESAEAIEQVLWTDTPAPH